MAGQVHFTAVRSDGLKEKEIFVPTRLDRPLTQIAGPFVGPVKLGQFEDGTIIVAGPNDKPVLIRNGKVMHFVEKDSQGDVVFSYFDDAERQKFATSNKD